MARQARVRDDGLGVDVVAGESRRHTVDARDPDDAGRREGEQREKDDPRPLHPALGARCRMPRPGRRAIA